MTPSGMQRPVRFGASWRRAFSWTAGLLLTAVLLPGKAVASSDGVEEIVVTTSRGSEPAGETPYATTTLDEREIGGGRPTLSLGEALAQVPGVFVTSRFNFAQDTRLSIRGFGARSAFGVRGVRIILDGIPLTLPDGQSQVDSIDPASLGRVEVLRGPAGSLYGNAAGGVLVLETKDAPTPAEVEVSQVVGAYALSKTSILGRGRFGAAQATVFASRTYFDGYRERSKTEQVTAQARVAVDLTPSVRWSSVLHYIRSPEAQDSGGLTQAELESTPEIAAPNNVRFSTGEELTQLQVGSRLVAEVSKGQRLELVAHAGVRSFVGAIPFRVVDFSRDFYGALATYRWSAGSADVRNRLTLGVEFQAQEDARDNEGNAGGRANGVLSLRQDERALSFGAFVQERVSPMSGLVLLGSARYDRVEFDLSDRLLDDGDASGTRTFDQLTAQGGIVWSVPLGASVFANVSQSFETPTFTELVNSGPDGGLSDLEAQDALSVEGGFRFRSVRFALDLAAFWIDLRNQLVPREDEENRTFFENSGESRRIGLEAFARATLLNGLELRAGYTWMDSEDQPGLPEHRMFGRIRYTVRGFHVAGEVEWVGPRFVDDDATVEASAYALAELRAGVRAELLDTLDTDVTVGVRNLFDETYADNVRINAFGGRFFEPAPPLHVFARWAIRFVAP